MTDAVGLILGAHQAALGAVDPEAATDRVVTGLADIADSGPVDIVAIGKAAIPMARGAVSALSGNSGRVFAITKDDHDLGEIKPDWVVRLAAHPVLDQRSLAATTDLLAWLADGDPMRPTLCLVSGGGSALLELPVESVSLKDFQTLTRSLLNAGADIHQLNTVRSRISQVKGGGLRRHIRSQRCVSLLLSDVLGNDPSVIASGPTVRSGRTLEDALAVLDHFNLTPSLPPHILAAICAEEGGKHDQVGDDEVQVIADNGIAIAAAAQTLEESGLPSQIIWRDKTGEAREAAIAWVEQLRALPADIDAIVGGGELTVTVHGDGIGGRNTEFALAAALAMHDTGLTGWTIASLATDGEDNTTGLVGAVVDGESFARMQDLDLDPRAELAANNSAYPLRQIKATHSTGPTGTNVNDLYFAVRTQSA